MVHPNKLLIASGQTAGHNRKEGKVTAIISIHFQSDLSSSAAIDAAEVIARHLSR